MKKSILTDLFVPHYDSEQSSVNNIITFLNYILGLDVAPGDLDSAILVLTSYVTYITYESFYGIFPVSSSNVNTSVRRLINKGYLTKHGFDRFDGTSKSYYAITAAGYRIANSVSKNTIPKYRFGRKDTAVAHIYSTGLNLMAALSLSVPITYKRELTVMDAMHHAKGSRKGELQTDGVITVHPVNGNIQHLYIEQDMGYENDSVLYDKMCRYSSYGLLRDNSNILIFSFRLKGIQATAPSGGARKNPYSATALRGILHLMEEYNCDDAYKLLRYPLLEDQRNCLILILTACDALKEIKGEYRRGRTTVTQSFMKEYISSLSIRRNPYVLRELNKQHQRLKERRHKKFIHLFIEWLCDGSISSLLFDLLSGAPLYMVNTGLLCNDLRLILPEISGYAPVLKESLTGLYYHIGNYCSLTPAYSFDGYGRVRFRNCFSYSVPDGSSLGYVCFCYACIDASAWVRAWFFHHKQLNGQTPPIHLIMVFDTNEQVELFYRMINAYYTETSLCYDKPAILSIMRYDIGKRGRIFTLTDPFSFHPKSRYYFSPIAE